ncbi:MAG: bifunctional diaminohydroxyphosphoribosylaminopyrimidine deaminase/5-amino-6-(5-phosphoribosylamino)uracil reductase RibD [Lacibacter sp.]
MTLDERYMHRCIELAQKGRGFVAPNPMVGSVLVCNGEIIAEGWHRQYGEAHAEVNCINEAIAKGYADKFAQSTLYVSLEPCAHFGKTPPCSNLIIEKKIPKVVIGCRDPFPEVNGKGIEKLHAAGVETIVDVLKKECVELNKRFFTFHQQHRPYILLKWAQTADQKIAGISTDRLLISNEFSNRLVHQWRSEEAAILVGTNTALLDNPQLTIRYWQGKQPVRLVLDKTLRLPESLKLFNNDASTIIFNLLKTEDAGRVKYHQLKNEKNLLQEMMHALYELKIQSVLVEGGATLLQHFIDADLWDEARVIQNEHLQIGEGLSAPVLKNQLLLEKEQLQSDAIYYYVNQN